LRAWAAGFGVGVGAGGVGVGVVAGGVGVGVVTGGVGVGVCGVAVGVGTGGVGVGVCGVAVGVGTGGVGVGVVTGGVGVGVTTARTVVEAVKELFDWLLSITSPKTEAVSLSDPATVGVTTKVTVALFRNARVPRLQLTRLVPLQLP
jgi:hypothetical protein